MTSSESTESFICEICSKVFAERFDLRNHFAAKHKTKSPKVSKRLSLKKPPHVGNSTLMAAPTSVNYMDSYIKTLQLAMEFSQQKQNQAEKNGGSNDVAATVRSVPPSTAPQKYTIPKRKRTLHETKIPNGHKLPIKLKKSNNDDNHSQIVKPILNGRHSPQEKVNGYRRILKKGASPKATHNSKTMAAKKVNLDDSISLNESEGRTRSDVTPGTNPKIDATLNGIAVGCPLVLSDANSSQAPPNQADSVPVDAAVHSNGSRLPAVENPPKKRLSARERSQIFYDRRLSSLLINNEKKPDHKERKRRKITPPPFLQDDAATSGPKRPPAAAPSVPDTIENITTSSARNKKTRSVNPAKRHIRQGQGQEEMSAETKPIKKRKKVEGKTREKKDKKKKDKERKKRIRRNDKSDVVLPPLKDSAGLTVILNFPDNEVEVQPKTTSINFNKRTTNKRTNCSVSERLQRDNSLPEVTTPRDICTATKGIDSSPQPPSTQTANLKCSASKHYELELPLREETQNEPEHAPDTVESELLEHATDTVESESLEHSPDTVQIEQEPAPVSVQTEPEQASDTVQTELEHAPDTVESELEHAPDTVQTELEHAPLTVQTERTQDEANIEIENICSLAPRVKIKLGPKTKREIRQKKSQIDSNQPKPLSKKVKKSQIDSNQPKPLSKKLKKSQIDSNQPKPLSKKVNKSQIDSNQPKPLSKKVKSQIDSNQPKPLSKKVKKSQIDSNQPKPLSKKLKKSQIDSNQPKPLSKKVKKSRVGSDEARLSCKYCQKHFKRQSNRTVHEKRAHPQAPAQECLERDASQAASSTTFPCSSCGKIFKRDKNWQRHQRMHKRLLNRFYKCRYCQKFYNTLPELRRHKLIHKDEVCQGRGVYHNNVVVKREPPLSFQIKEETPDSWSSYQNEYSNCLEAVMPKLDVNDQSKGAYDDEAYWILPFTNFKLIKAAPVTEPYSFYRGPHHQRVGTHLLGNVYVRVLRLSANSNGPLECKVPAALLKRFSKTLRVNVVDLKYSI